jgi:hypothetical protein
LIRLGLATCPLNRDQSARTHRLTRSQPASRLWRQPELCQQGAEVTAQDGVRGGAFQNGCQARSIRFHTVGRARRVPRVREVSLQGVRYDVTQAVIPAVPVGGRTTCQCLRIPSHNGPVTTAQSSQLIDFFVKPVILTAQGQNTPPTVKCWRFLHFRNLKHRNLSRLILRQSVTTHPADPPPYPDHSQPACVWTSASARTALKPNEI